MGELRRVFIADDDDTLRLMLRTIIGLEAEMVVCRRGRRR